MNRRGFVGAVGLGAFATPVFSAQATRSGVVIQTFLKAVENRRAQLGRFITLRLTTRDLRTIDKVGVLEFAKKHGMRLN